MSLDPGSHEYATILARLEAELLAELKSTGDPRMIDDGKFFETSPMSDVVTKPKPKSKGKGKGKKK